MMSESVFAISSKGSRRYMPSTRGVLFHPVCWEDAVGGGGRPQAQINEDLKQCDYAVFVLHDRWGSPTGGGFTSGTEEEWDLAEKLYKDKKIRNIALFFKNVDSGKVADPGEHLKPVLVFKKRIEEERRYLFHQYGAVTQFAEILERHLARWLRDHGSAGSGLSGVGPMTVSAATPSSAGSPIPAVAPQFDYWIAEAIRLLDAGAPGYAGAIFCAVKAVDTANSDIEWAKAKNAVGVAQFHLGKLDEAFASFAGVLARFGTATELPLREQVANALFNKGATLGALDRSMEEIAVYDDLLARFGTATELPLRERVAKALFNKGIRLGALDRSMEEIAIYDDLLARFGTATELPLRELVANVESRRRDFRKS